VQQQQAECGRSLRATSGNSLDTHRLDRRIPDKQALIDEVAAWQASRNKRDIKADWQFTNADHGVKLKMLYPAI
jgi:hypothetical protein